MIVECENCGSNFDVDDIMLMPSGRKLKCSSCKTVFFQPPPSEDEEPITDFPSQTDVLDEAEEEAFFEEEEEVDSEADTFIGPSTPGMNQTSDFEPEEISSFDPEEEEEEEITSFDQEEEEEEEITSFSQDAEEEEEEITSFDQEEEEEEEIISFSQDAEEEKEPSFVASKPDPDFSLDSEEMDEEDEETDEDDFEPVAGSPFMDRITPFNKIFLSLAALLLVVLGANWLSFTQWWEYKSHSMSSDFQLTQLEGEWRSYEFGPVLLIQGSIKNTSKVTQSVPKIGVSLYDEANKQLNHISVVPDRIVSDEILDNSGESALRSITELQEDVNKIKVDKLWPNKEMKFQALFIQPPVEASRYQIDYEPLGDEAKSAGGAKTGRPGTRTFSGNF
ncbi:MAG: zinc-ribbon domain-containing protein [Magnetococcales bacterium]|nr:zinc-ribbon domain-containing protein [Magnetococcales bacterium]